MSTKAQHIRVDETSDTELPEGWVSVLLEDHVYIAGRIGWRGLKRAEYTDRGPVFLAVKNILDDGSIDFADVEHISEYRYDESPEIILRSDDILLTKDGTIGKVGMVLYLPQKTTVNSSILVVRPNDDLLTSRYLFHFLRGPQFQEIAHQRITGSAVPHLFQKDIKKLTALVPPISDQRRIATKLEALLGKVNSSRTHLEKIPRILVRFRQAVLAAACSGKLTQDWREAKAKHEEQEWPEVVLADICESISDGDHQPPPKRAAGIPFLTIGNVSSGCLDFSQTRFVPEEYFNAIQPERKPRKRDVLYTVVGATIGIPVLVDTDRPFCFQRHIALLRPSEKCSSKFLWIIMASPEVFRQAWSGVTGSAQPTLPLGNLRTIPAKLPPIEEQHEIIRRVDALFKLADAIEKRVAAATVRAEKLTQAILAKAFRGELVPTEAELARREGRGYESASVLLERIRKEREKGSEKSKRGKRVKAAAAKSAV
jgi:type I restriction enzyme S subunit